jgi:hypothetical protein
MTIVTGLIFDTCRPFRRDGGGRRMIGGPPRWEQRGAEWAAQLSAWQQMVEPDQGAGAPGRGVRFAPDSLLEEAGFEPWSLPRAPDRVWSR